MPTTLNLKPSGLSSLLSTRTSTGKLRCDRFVTNPSTAPALCIAAAHRQVLESKHGQFGSRHGTEYACLCICVAQFAESLWAGLGLQRVWQEPPPPAPPPPQPRSAPLPPTGSGLSNSQVLAIAIPCAFVFLVLLGAGAFLAVRRGWMGLKLSGPPSVGPSTTLVVVSDVTCTHAHGQHGFAWNRQ